MEGSKFNEVFSALKPIIDNGKIEDYFSQKPISQIGFSDDQVIRLLKYINAHQFVTICKNTFGFPLDFSPENLIFIDQVITSLCALDLDHTKISKLLLRDAKMSHKLDASARGFLMAYTLVTHKRDPKFNSVSAELSQEQLFELIDDRVIAEIISNINDYMCETAIALKGGEYACDAVVDGHKDALGIIIHKEYVSFLDAIYSRFFVEDLPVSYVFCARFALDFGEQSEILSKKYEDKNPQ